jgi:hypothetical protein
MSMRTALVFPIALAAALSAIHCSPAQADALPPCAAGVPFAAQRCAVPSPTPHLEVVDDGLSTLPTFTQSGRRYVLGESGERYRVRIVNPTGARVEAVVSVDGLDAVDGRPANLSKRGYIIPAYGDVVVDGWRTSLDTVAAFRFSSVHDSYAGRTGHARNVGVIGVAFFRERPQPRPVTVWHPPPPAAPLPQAAPSRSRDAEGAADNAAGGSGGAAHKSEAAAPSAAASEARPGLGTQFGETQESHVEETTFVRAESRPMTVEELRYDDRDGLVSRGIDLAPPPDPRWNENALRDSAEAFPQPRFAQPPR